MSLLVDDEGEEEVPIRSNNISELIEVIDVTTTAVTAANSALARPKAV